MYTSGRRWWRSLRQIADRLNTDGHTTRRGRPWDPVQVARVLGRAGTDRAEVWTMNYSEHVVHAPHSVWDGLAFGVASTEDSSYRAAKCSSSIRWIKV